MREGKIGKMTIDDIIKFVKNWRASHGYGAGEELSSGQMEVFIGELQQQISYMDFSLSEETTVIGYAGESNAVPAWSIVKNVSETYGDAAAYITTLPAGQLLNDEGFRKVLLDFLLQDEDALNMITSGYKDGVRVGPSCGYGDYLTLDDFVSAKLMGESVGVSENVIIFCPGEVDPNKVFASTEIDKIFSNNSFKYINGISKEELYAIYRSGEEGKKTVFQIISRTSQEAVGGALELNEQAEALRMAFGENGILNSSSSDFVLNVCFDSQGNQIGMELFSYRKNSSLLSGYTGEHYIINGSGSNVAFKTEYSRYMNYADDVTMELEFGSNYNNLTKLEKLQAKELEFYVYNISTIVDKELLSSTTLKYLEGSKKTVEELSMIDRQIINLCSGLSVENTKCIRGLNNLVKAIQSSEKVVQFVKTAGRLVYCTIDI